jgi:2-dehydro-3-deoxyphosphogluconate aldolase/(4S)-4-hydroxy-2-oxoglutarate aldolase
MREAIIQKILDEKLIAIVRGMEEKTIIPLAEAFIAGGINMMEITFNQAKPESFEATMRSIAAVKEKLGNQLVCGAGTVISVEQVDLAAKAGALFIVSPNVDAEVIRRTHELGLVSLPGCTTASECLTAHNAGADFIKAGALGLGVGGNLVNKDWIASGQFDKISDLARKLVAAVKS